MSVTTEIPRRKLGSTGEEVTILGLGGAHISREFVSDDEADRIVRSAVDAGINFLDNSCGYGDGLSEERMGKALRGGCRDKVFLMTKFDARDKAGALRQLDGSLKRLRTDHLDLWQLHAVSDPGEPDLISKPGSALEAMEEARQSGKVRYVGFTGHSYPSVHLAMLDLDYTFDTVQLPLNVFDAHFKSFERQVLPRLIDMEIGVIGMKPLVGGRLFESGAVGAEDALRYAFSLPADVIVTGMDSMETLEQALRAARGFTPLSQEERNAILACTAPEEVSGNGDYEWYKGRQ